MQRVRLTYEAVFLSALAVLSCFAGVTSGAQSSLDVLDRSDLEEGQKLFRVHCARCHGMKGQGGEGANLNRPRLKHVTDDETLIQILSSGIPGTGMPGTRGPGEKGLLQIAGYVRSLGRLPREIPPGDAARGRVIYATKGGCPACHIVNGSGTGIGPELSDVGQRRGLEYLKESLLAPGANQPSRQGIAAYLAVRLKTGAGLIEGMRVNEDAFSIQIRDLDGTIHSFDKREIEELEKVFGHSLMPAYRIVLAEEELADVVSYLMSLKGES
ncbi:MAG: c-type cytochrome [Gammaproteobacteria bacterium]|nr:c-type cytochrome [Gammaproteobacteria bacterium]